MSLEKSRWNLPQILSLFEGGNDYFMAIIKKPIKRLLAGHSKVVQENRKHKPQKGSTSKDVPLDITDQLKILYDHSPLLQRYKEALDVSVTTSCKNFGGQIFDHCRASIVSDDDLAYGSSMVTLVMHQASGERKERNDLLLRKKRRPSFCKGNLIISSTVIRDEDCSSSAKKKSSTENKDNRSSRTFLRSTSFRNSGNYSAKSRETLQRNKNTDTTHFAFESKPRTSFFESKSRRFIRRLSFNIV